MKHFGIIGYPLEHSFSAQYFNRKFKEENIDAEYSLYPLKDIKDFPLLIERHQFAGLNVTMPYKQSVIPFLAGLDESARESGAVNVISIRDGLLWGYNTDAIGFKDSLNPILRESDKQALVLGTGGAAHAIAYALRVLNINATFVSRQPATACGLQPNVRRRSPLPVISYHDLTEQVMATHPLIVNCTPLGMHPRTENKPPIPYEMLTAAHFLYDCIYNPDETLFLKEGIRRGCRTKNGIEMLHGQARKAWEIWGE